MQGSKASFGASSKIDNRLGERAGVVQRNFYRITARDAQGNELWVEEVQNLVTTQGLNDTLTKYFKGSAYTAAFYLGLINNANFSALAAGDTAAKITTGVPSGGTNGWAESTAYTESVRQTVTLGTAAGGSIDNTASAAVFTINAAVTINGIFMVTTSTKGATTGVLYGEVSFATPRAFSGAGGETLTIELTLTQASA
jgi:hypothetical protein